MRVRFLSLVSVILSPTTSFADAITVPAARNESPPSTQCKVTANAADDFYIELSQYAPSPVVVTAADGGGKNLTVRFDPYEKNPQLRHVIHLDKGDWIVGAWVEPIRSTKDPDINLSLAPKVNGCAATATGVEIVLDDKGNVEKARIRVIRRDHLSLDDLIGGMRSDVATGLAQSAAKLDATAVVVTPTVSDTIVALIKHHLEARAAAWITRRAKELFCTTDPNAPFAAMKRVCRVFKTTSPPDLISNPTSLIAAVLRDAIDLSSTQLPEKYTDLSTENLKAWLTRSLLEQAIDAIPAETRKIRGEARLALLSLTHGPWLAACSADTVSTKPSREVVAACGAALVFGVAADCINRTRCTPDEVLARLAKPADYYTLAGKKAGALFDTWSTSCPADCLRPLLSATTAVVDLLGSGPLDVQQEIGRFGDVLAAISYPFDAETSSQLHDLSRAIEAGDTYALFAAAYHVFEPRFTADPDQLSVGMRLIAAVSAFASLRTQQLTQTETENRMRALDTWLEETRMPGLSADRVFFSVGLAPGLALGKNTTRDQASGPFALTAAIAMDVVFHTSFPAGIHLQVEPFDGGALIDYHGNTDWKSTLGLGGSVGFSFGSWSTPIVASFGARYTGNGEAIVQASLSVYLRVFQPGN